MYIAFLDELGHIGPYLGRADPQFNHSPVFGLAGYVLPYTEVRRFATWFFKHKSHVLAYDLKKSGKHPATWEKKGTDIFTTTAIKKYPNIRKAAFHLINHIEHCNGKIFYYAREKYQSPAQSHATGLYTTVLGHAITNLDSFCIHNNKQLTMILDQHSDRIKLLETATKTMFGSDPCRSLIEPPFHVESHLYQTVQAADWIATLVGRLLAYRISPDYADWEWAERLFGQRIDHATTHSRIWRPRRAPSPPAGQIC